MPITLTTSDTVKRAMAAHIAILLAITLLSLAPTRAQAQTDAELRWSVDRDDLGIVDGNDVSIEGEPIQVDAAGHPLVIGPTFDEDDPFAFQPGRVIALDPTDGSEAWSREPVVFDDLGVDPLALLSTGDVLVIDDLFDPDVGEPGGRPVVLDATDGTVVDNYGEVEGYVRGLFVLPGDAIGFRVDDGRGTDGRVEVRDPGGEVRWSMPDPDFVSYSYNPLLPDVILGVRREFSPERQSTLLAVDPATGQTQAEYLLGGEFALTPAVLPSGLLVANSSTGFDEDARGWIELLDLDGSEFALRDGLSTDDGNLGNALLGIDLVAPDGSTVVGVSRAYLGGEFAPPGPLAHQLIEIDQAAGSLTAGALLDAAFERSIQSDDSGDRPVSTLNAASPRGVPDASLMIAAVPNLGENGQTAVYGQDLDGQVVWEIPASTDIGGTHDFSEVCADGSLYGRSTTFELGENEFGQPTSRKVEVWYAIDGAAPAVEGDGCARPAPTFDTGPNPDPGDGGLACGGFDGDPSTTERADFDDPIEYAVAVSRARFGCGGDDRAADHVVLSRDDAFADSLVGTALTGNAPMLFTQTDSLPAVTREEVNRLLDDGDTIYILGGEVAVSAAVESTLAETYAVQRLAGPSRVETSVAVAEEVLALRAAAASFAAEDVVSVAVARAGGPPDNPTAAWADSVTAGAWTAMGGIPTVVTDTASVHPAVEQFIESLEATQPVATVLMGGTAALSAEVEAELPSPRRIAGDSRAGTAQAVAQDLVGVDPGAKGSRLIMVNGYREDGWLFGLPAAGLAADGSAAIALAQTPVPPETLALACSPVQVDVLLIGSIDILDQQAADEIDGAPTC